MIRKEEKRSQSSACGSPRTHQSHYSFVLAIIILDTLPINNTENSHMNRFLYITTLFHHVSYPSSTSCSQYYVYVINSDIKVDL